MQAAAHGEFCDARDSHPVLERSGPFASALSAPEGCAGFAEPLFERSAVQLAPALLGAVLVRPTGRGAPLRARIVEVEAYLGDGTDAASHSHRGPTPRNRSMFGAPGHFYVYRSMGIHHCLNVVCEARGRGAAVLLRAAEPLEGHALIAHRRGTQHPRDWLSGPGKLCQAFGVTLAEDGLDVREGALQLRPGAAPAERILCGPRIGIRKAQELPYRFFLEGSPHVTRSPLNRAARPLRTPATAQAPA